MHKFFLPLLFLCISVHADAQPAIPSAAQMVGYVTNTFSVNQFNAANTDIKDVSRQGFSWYPWKFFGSKVNLGSLLINQDGSLTLNGDVTGPNGQIASLSPARDGKSFYGKAFGGGAYFEAVIKFDPNKVKRSGVTAGWPSFWSMAVEHLVTNNDQWVDRALDYKHFAEADFFEYDVFSDRYGTNSYGINLHDWYGLYKKTCDPNSFCDAHLPFDKVLTTAPTNTVFTDYHKFGFLWVPATATSNGYAQAYLDDRPMGTKTSWTKVGIETDDPSGMSWQYGIMDQQHMVVILGTGINEPITVKSVNVWQMSDAKNITSSASGIPAEYRVR